MWVVPRLSRVKLKPLGCVVPRGRLRTLVTSQVWDPDKATALSPSIRTAVPLSDWEKSHFNDFSKLNVNFKSLFLCSLTAASHFAAGQEMTCGGGQRFSPDFIVQTLMRRVGAALPTGCRRCLLSRDASRILRGFFTESRGWKWLGMCFTHLTARTEKSFKLN